MAVPPNQFSFFIHNVRFFPLQESKFGDLSIEVVTTVTQAHSDWVTSVCWTSSPLNLLVSGSVDCHVKLWDFKTPTSHKVGSNANYPLQALNLYLVLNVCVLF